MVLLSASEELPIPETPGCNTECWVGCSGGYAIGTSGEYPTPAGGPARVENICCQIKMNARESMLITSNFYRQRWLSNWTLLRYPYIFRNEPFNIEVKSRIHRCKFHWQKLRNREPRQNNRRTNQTGGTQINPTFYKNNNIKTLALMTGLSRFPSAMAWIKQTLLIQWTSRVDMAQPSAD